MFVGKFPFESDSPVREISYLTLQKNVDFLCSGPKEPLAVFSSSTLFLLLKLNFPVN